MRSRLFALTCLAVTLAAASLTSCGEASVKLIEPTPTPGLNFTFRGGVIPALKARDCARSSCHDYDGGSPSGQIPFGGNTISAALLYTMIVTSGGTLQRGGGDLDVNIADPPSSLILAKPDSDDPGVVHGGGKLFGKADDTYKVILGWIQMGAPNN